MLRKLLKCRNGSMHIMLIFIIFFAMGALCFISEALHINGINDHINDELNRAANLAIKEAMYDSYRIDYVGKFNEELAITGFYDYLYDEMGLDNSLRKYNEGRLAYTIEIKELNIDGDTTRLNLKAITFVPSLFGFGMDWQLPIDVTSRNMRVDGR